jgi:hypothetical protein
MLRQIIEKTYEFNVDIHQLFIDYKQAYDSINRQQMYKIMKEFGIPEKLINLVKMTLRRTLNKVQISGKLTVLKQHAASDEGMHFLPCCLTSCWKR